MSDLISRGKLLGTIEPMVGIWYDKNFWIDYKRVLEIIEDLPSVEPERKTFHVIDKTTGKEADPYEIALNEDWAKSLCYCDMEGFAILEDGTLILADECGRFEYIQENDRFEIVWDEVTDEN